MLKLYKHIILFLIPIILGWLVVELFYRITPNNYTVKTEEIQKQAASIETLILGDSHAFYGVDPEYISSTTFNIANISQSLYFDELLLKKYIDKLPLLNTVMINISYFSLSAVENGTEDAWRKYFYEADMELEVPIVSSLDPKKYSLAFSRRLQKSVSLMYDYVLDGTIVHTYTNGYGIQDERDITPDKEYISALIAKKHEDGSVDFFENTQRLQRMLSLCKKNNIKVLLVKMPVYPAYYNLLNNAKNQKINTTLTQLEAKNTHVIFLDWSQHPAFNKQDLRDADHLTNEGAKKFSLLLNEEIKKITQL